MRILCLHSFRTSAQFLKLQLNNLSNFGSSIGEGADLHFIDGPHKCTPEEAAVLPASLRRFVGETSYQWWDAVETGDAVAYNGIDTTLDYINNYIKAHGPFDGVLGFSQGGSLAHLLCILKPQNFRFAVFISARTSRHHEHLELMSNAREQPLKVPSLVVYGGLDTDVLPEQTVALIKTLDPQLATEIFVPDGKHKVPLLDATRLTECKSFFQRAASKI